MHPVLLKWGSLQLYSYGLMLGLAFLAGIAWVNRDAQRERFNSDELFMLIIIVMVASLLGARFTYVLINWDFYRDHLDKILAFRDGGLVFQGGLLAGLVVSFFYVRVKRYLFLQLADLFAPAIALGYGIARIGCFLNGCCYGVETGSSWGVIFPGAGPFPRHPTQLYASAAGLLIFIILVYLRRRKSFHGFVFSWFMILYGLYRFSIEFIRINPPVWGVLTFAQLAALVSIIIGVAILARGSRPGNSLKLKE